MNLTKVAVSNALSQKIDASLANLTISITEAEIVNKTTLQSVINLAQSIYDRAVEGTQVGEFAAGSKAVLLAAIQAATAVNTAPVVSQQQLDDAAIVLNEAIQTFNEQFITIFAPGDANEDNLIDIGDLGTVAVHYGKTSASSDWSKAKVLTTIMTVRLTLTT